MIDQIDLAILRHLEIDGRATQRELGRAVGLSPNAAGARMSRLIESGVISGIHAHIDHSKLGRPLEVMIDVWIDHRPDDESLIDLVARDERIVDAIHLTGPVDYRIQARVGSPEDLDDLLATMRAEGNVQQTDSRIIMRHLQTRG